MLIRVLFFGALKELVGRSNENVDLPDGARVNDLLSRYGNQFPRFAAMRQSLAVSVNQEYSRADRALLEGDEVGLLPPVSGGAKSPVRGEVQIVREVISTAAILDRLKRTEDGAAVVFEGVVRDNTRGRRTLYLEYEAYESMALNQMTALAELTGASS